MRNLLRDMSVSELTAPKETRVTIKATKTSAEDTALVDKQIQLIDKEIDRRN